MAVNYPKIPETITVHLGTPDSKAENITIPFVDYVKNVASSEIYPTWPENALRANIYAIITFALNRIYSEWYPSRGYNFDITSSTQFDQAFVKDRDVFENISVIVDEIYNDYVTKGENIEPYFTQFCNGTTVTCDGLSQWGTVSLANKGLTPFQILENYYGNNINLVQNAPIEMIEDSYPGTPLTVGTASNEVQTIQKQLNRISNNYPDIPKIKNPNSIFDVNTENAVKKFQEIFNLPVTGAVDKATWYKIKRYYTAVKRVGELVSEGISYDEATTPYTEVLKVGMQNGVIAILQYYLNIIGYFNPNLSLLPINSVFGEKTLNAVNNFQAFYGLPVTGIVDKQTWDKISSVYDDILKGLPEGYEKNNAKLYPGYFLTEGARGEDVRDLQTYLSFIGKNLKEVPQIKVDGVYGPNTRDAVFAFQKLFGLPLTGSVGPITWYQISNEYNDLRSQA